MILKIDKGVYCYKKANVHVFVNIFTNGKVIIVFKNQNIKEIITGRLGFIKTIVVMSFLVMKYTNKITFEDIPKEEDY